MFHKSKKPKPQQFKVISSTTKWGRWDGDREDKFCTIAAALAWCDANRSWRSRVGSRLYPNRIPQEVMTRPAVMYRRTSGGYQHHIDGSAVERTADEHDGDDCKDGQRFHRVRWGVQHISEIAPLVLAKIGAAKTQPATESHTRAKPSPSHVMPAPGVLAEA